MGARSCCIGQGQGAGHPLLKLESPRLKPLETAGCCVRRRPGTCRLAGYAIRVQLLSLLHARTANRELERARETGGRPWRCLLLYLYIHVYCMLRVHTVVHSVNRHMRMPTVWRRPRPAQSGQGHSAPCHRDSSHASPTAQKPTLHAAPYNVLVPHCRLRAAPRLSSPLVLSRCG